MTVTRVFIVDDHEVVRRGLRGIVEDEDGLVVVGEAGTASQARMRLANQEVDVVIIDTDLPDGTGADLCRWARERWPRVAVLMLALTRNDEELFAAIAAGAAGFLLSEVSGRDLVDAIRRLAAGQSLIDPAVTRTVLERLRHPPGDPLTCLSPQERRVFAYLSEGLSNREIAARMSLTEKTVKNYVSAVLAKLGLERRAQAAAFAREHGL